MILRDWVSFFNDAGVQSSSAKSYADAFVQNTIVGDMLADLNKEYLNDMGIKVVGDIIRILRQELANITCLLETSTESIKKVCFWLHKLTSHGHGG